MNIEGIEKRKIVLEQIKRSDGVISLKHLKTLGGKYLSTTEIVFIDKNGKKFDFSSLLPNGWKFASYEEINKNRYPLIGNGFSADYKTKTIFYEDLSKDGALFALLHEIGHSWLAERVDGSFEEILNSYISDYQNRELTIEDIKNRGENPNDYVEIRVYDPYGKGTGGLDNDEVWFSMLVPKEIIKKYGKAWAENERNAWAYALKQLRKLRREGFVIEPNLKNFEEIESEIYSCLATYDEFFSKEYKDQSQYFTKGKKFKAKNIE